MLGDAYDRTDVLNLGHPEYVRAALIAGLGFAAMPRLAVEGDIASGVLKALPTPSIFEIDQRHPPPGRGRAGPGGVLGPPDPQRAGGFQQNLMRWM